MRSTFLSSTRVLVLLAGFVLCMAALKAPAIAQTTERVSVSTEGVQGDGSSWYPRISADGRFVVFHSHAGNLVPSDTNYVSDVFLHDRLDHTTQRISVSSTGVQGNLPSQDAAISADGRFIAFESSASNLVPGDTNTAADIFVYDRLNGSIERVSVSTTGAQGSYHSLDPIINADGSVVAFHSHASNLVAGDTNGVPDVFVRDRINGVTERVSVTSGGGQSNGHSSLARISGDGQVVAFVTLATNLAFGDDNGTWDAYVHDRSANITQCVSVTPDGTVGNNVSFGWSITADGTMVALQSYATDLVPGDENGFLDVFVRDLSSGTTECVSVSDTGDQGNHNSMHPSITPDGSIVAFCSVASNLAPGDADGVLDWDVFVRDRIAGTTACVSLSTSGEEGNSHSQTPSISVDGRSIAFLSEADNLVPNDTNYEYDIFVRQLPPPGNTQPGSNVPVTPGEDIEMTFAEVTQAGDTTVTVSANPPGGPPSGFKFLGAYYDIVTTAEFSGTVTISFPYDPASVPPARAETLKAFHFDPAGGWQDVTVSVDTLNHRVVAAVTGISCFGIAYPIYQFQGFLPPVGGDNSKPFKRGSTIPLKFRITDEVGNSVTDAIATLVVNYGQNGAPSGEPEVVSTAAGDGGDTFRYDAADDLYIFNLSTKDASYLDYYTYVAEVQLDDWETYSVDFSLK